MLYDNPATTGDTVIVPFANVQVGCAILTVGAVGMAGCGVMVTLVAPDTQPALLLAVTLYVPAAIFENVPEVLV